MKVIGITGGVGSGKSRVLEFLETEFPAVICQADHVAWKLQEPGQECYQEIVKAFGTEIVNTDGTINRKVLGAIVFSDKEQLKKLNKIMHPAVKEYICQWIEDEKCKETSYFFLEAALLLEENYQEICDEIWYIYAQEDVRCQRLIENRAYSEEKIKAIMKNQLSDEDFRKHCTVILDNSHDFEMTCAQIRERMSK